MTTKLKQCKFRMNDDLWLQFTIKTAKEGITKNDKLVELVKEYLNYRKPSEYDYKKMISTRTYNNTIHHIAIQYISYRTEIPEEKIEDYCENELGLEITRKI